MRKSVVSKQLSVISVMATMAVVASGCGGMRFAATAAQKENAWLHARVCMAAAQTASEEEASARLCGLTALAEKQSEAFVLDYGLPLRQAQGGPDPLPGSAGTPPKVGELGQKTPGQAWEPGRTEAEVEAMLSEGTAIAEAAKADAAKRPFDRLRTGGPDAWALADGALELGIALAGLLGGVYGARAAGFLRQAREKSKALQEIVAGNELFKQLYPEQAERFKEAQGKQSQTTKTIVTELK